MSVTGLLNGGQVCFDESLVSDGGTEDQPG